MKDSREWLQGNSAQQAWADVLRHRGNAVVPTYAFEDVAPETKAPVMLVPNGVRVLPDLLNFRYQDRATWHEVKSKSVPTWYRIHARWEHGCDYSLSQEYSMVQDETGLDVWIVVFETASPLDDEHDSLLELSGRWFGIALNKALAYGEHRVDWPGGKSQPFRRGRKGMGGLLWPRRRMLEMEAAS